MKSVDRYFGEPIPILTVHSDFFRHEDDLEEAPQRVSRNLGLVEFNTITILRYKIMT